MRTRVNRAFTLVEILIVVVILGILAAIVVPQFTNASEDAQVGNVESQLQTIRAQIELYRVRNNGQYPPSLAAGDWTDLIGADYLRAAPVNPRTGRSEIGAADDAAVGWLWVDGADDDALPDTIQAAYFNENHRDPNAPVGVQGVPWRN
jgi:prepilin-type N-terminal cleavage/methylation domain-containing protein